MTDHWTEQLSEYLDGDLVGAEREAMEAHLATCAECSATLRELSDVVARARSLPDQYPDEDLWPPIAALTGIAAKATPEPTPRATRRRHWGRRFTVTLPQLAAAGVALMLITGGMVWLSVGVRGSPEGSNAPVALRSPLSGQPSTSPASFGGPSYDQAVAELSRVLEQGRGQLDTTTVRVLEENLAIIDRAIAQARRALEADPANGYLNVHLAHTMKRKLELLRRAAAMTSAAS